MEILLSFKNTAELKITAEVILESLFEGTHRKFNNAAEHACFIVDLNEGQVQTLKEKVAKANADLHKNEGKEPTRSFSVFTGVPILNDVFSAMPA
ncbi:MAG: hypothetical protein A3B66_07740 [Alphaproteobacteria bacterium RIFCSPHIGHO2_02_FULL_46_13]|nr:MAG: hypothetical protein A3B66_07740 [Alphaproteobacteria bacterium RIFCSPHIGHO2_02_FULL_46_13]